eukprot:TRINITY_DN20977_c0_g1_i1.p2 TRINITY_DN20977_c0_g1~~TRINITY_DN20977_c0_g1_i1.p2  ORF type:complete len:232 (+),score=35.74 TRINITY_DN20977_c0_g1_i1:22-696(+)
MPPKIATPDLDHLTAEDFRHVYEPSADSFVAMDALENDEELIASRPTVCLEIGPGSGILTTFLAQLLRFHKHRAAFLAVDINPLAATASSRTFSQNSVVADVIVGDLLGPFLPRMEGKVDVLLFNPPYVPTDDEEVERGGIAAAWAGGSEGMSVVRRLLPLVHRLLSPCGLFYLVLIQQNHPELFLENEAPQYGLRGEVVLRRTCGEKLFVLRLKHAHGHVHST